MHGGYGWGMGYGWFFMIVFWGLVAAGIIYLIKEAIMNGRNRNSEPTPLDILKRRYANGEINREEFEEKKKDLL